MNSNTIAPLSKVRTFIFTVLLSFTFVSTYAQTVTVSADNGSPGSLRNIIASASSGAEITFASNINSIELNAQIVVDKNIRIIGNPTGKTTIDVRYDDRAFFITAGDFVLRNIKLINGRSLNGGAIYIDSGSVVATNCEFRNNITNDINGSGGVIYINTSSDLIMSNCILESNQSNKFGGAIEDNSGPGLGLTLDNVILRDNRSGLNADVALPGDGGAIHISGSGQAKITSCTIENNISENDGGGVSCSNGTLELKGTTLSANTSIGNGGAISISQNSNVDILVSTISGNTSSSNGGGIYHSGGQLDINASTVANNSSSQGGGVFSNSGALLKNSIVANNNAGSGKNLAGNINSNGYNILDGDALNSLNAKSTDRTNTDPLINSLANNGGGLKTHSLENGSPAYNGGDPSDNFPDQINQSVFDGRRDIGAYESQQKLSSNNTISERVIGLKLYPNPVRDQFFFELSKDYSIEKIEIVNLNGLKIKVINELDQYSIDVSELESGIYNCIFYLKDAITTKNFIKH